jgi:hypothetical protein
MRYLVFCALVALGPQAISQCKQSVPVIVLDEKTRTAVPSLTAEQLEAKIGKTSLSLSVEAIPHFRVLVIFDASRSMAEGAHSGKFLLLINQTLGQVFDKLPPNVQVELGVFSNKAAFGNRFTSDPKELTQSMVQAKEQLGASGTGKTALYDAIHEGLGRFDSFHPGDAILVVTDAGENHSTTTEKSLGQELRRKGVRLYSILIEGNVPQPEDINTVEPLVELVELSGGSIRPVDTKTVVKEDAEAGDLRRYWREEVLSGYMLEFSIPPSSDNEQKLHLFAKTGAFPKKKIVAIYPTHLTACSFVTASPP